MVLRSKNTRRSPKKADAALRESEERFRALFETSLEGMLLAEVESGRIRFPNPALQRMFGYSPEELSQMDILSLLPIDEAARLRAPLSAEALEKEGKAFFEGIRGLRKDGGIIYLDMSLVVALSGGQRYIMGLLRDISRRKRAEEALKEREEKYGIFFNAAGDAVLFLQLTADGRPDRYLEVNEAACRLYGYTREELTTMSPENLTAVELRPRIPELVQNLVERRYLLFEWKHLAKDGREIPVEITSRFFEFDGQPTVLSIVRDITERKKAQEKLAASLREKDVLLKEIHHRVKNNLQIISSLLRLQSRGIEDKRMQRVFNESQARIKSMALIHEKLYQSQDFTNIDFSDYMVKMATHLSVLYEASPRRIEVKIEAPDIKLDINQAIPCGLIINELVSNALRHAFPEGQKGDIFIIMAGRGDGHYRLMVRDNGIGLPPDVDIHKPKTLGLQIVNELVNQLDGRLEVRRNGETEFIVDF